MRRWGLGPGTGPEGRPHPFAQRPPAPFLAEKLKTPKNSTMPKRGKRSAASKKNGALGGRSSGPAGGHPTADAPQGAAALVAPSKKEADRPRNKPSAVPLVRRDPDRICLEDAALFGHGESPGDRPPAPRAFFEPEGRKSRAGQKRKQLPEQGQIKQGKGKQRGSLLADCLERAETKCAEVLAGLDQGAHLCRGDVRESDPGFRRARAKDCILSWSCSAAC